MNSPNEITCDKCHKNFTDVEYRIHYPNCQGEDDKLCDKCEEVLKSPKKWELTKIALKKVVKKCEHVPQGIYNSINYYDSESKLIFGINNPFNSRRAEVCKSAKCKDKNHHRDFDFSWKVLEPCQHCGASGKNVEETPEKDQKAQAIIQIQQYFETYNIKEIKRNGRELVITYLTPNQDQPLPIEEQGEISTFLVNNNLTELNQQSLQTLVNSLNEPKPTNYIPYAIGGGIGIVALIALVAYLITKKDKNRY